MRIALTVDYVGGVSKEVIAGAADMVAFEREFNLSVGSLAESPRLTHLYYLAWHSEKRTKATGLEFDEWLATVEGVGAGDTDPKS